MTTEEVHVYASIFPAFTQLLHGLIHSLGLMGSCCDHSATCHVLRYFRGSVHQVLDMCA